jgi:hypothetical protein
MPVHSHPHSLQLKFVDVNEGESRVVRQPNLVFICNVHGIAVVDEGELMLLSKVEVLENRMSCGVEADDSLLASNSISVNAFVEVAHPNLSA